MPKYKIGKIDSNSIILEDQKEQPQATPSLLITVVVVVLILAAVYALAS